MRFNLARRSKFFASEASLSDNAQNIHARHRTADKNNLPHPSGKQYLSLALQDHARAAINSVSACRLVEQTS
jgi:hypothetical protein